MLISFARSRLLIGWEMMTSFRRGCPVGQREGHVSALWNIEDRNYRLIKGMAKASDPLERNRLQDQKACCADPISGY
jgi:hypothetical protein